MSSYTRPTNDLMIQIYRRAIAAKWATEHEIFISTPTNTASGMMRIVMINGVRCAMFSSNTHTLEQCQQWANEMILAES